MGFNQDTDGPVYGGSPNRPITYQPIQGPNGQTFYQGSDGQTYTKGADGSYQTVGNAGQQAVPPGPPLATPGGSVLHPDPSNPSGAWIPTPTPQTPPVGGAGSGSAGLGSLFQPFGETFTAPAPVNLGGPAGIPYIPPVPTLNLPTFTPPPAFTYADYKPPTAADVLNDPSYTLRKDEGEAGIVNSAAAQGLERSGGNLMDILKYNQNFASSEYGNIVDRSLKQYDENRANAAGTYSTNYQTQFVDPYTFNTQAAKDAFAPQFAQWQVQGQAGQRQNELNNDQAWQKYLQDYRSFDDQRKFQYGVLSDQQRLGITAATA